MKQLVLASNNKGKIAEFAQLLRPLGIQVEAQNIFGVPECDEPFCTFVENALHKARHASQFSGLPALADDSGLCVPALNDAPGVYSARYAGDKNDASNNKKLIENIKNITDRRAYYYCVLVLVRYPDDPQPLIAEGLWWGEVQLEAVGDGGFGYDPHFYLPILNQTVAQLPAEQKNTLSHRALATQKLLARLDEILK